MNRDAKRVLQLMRRDALAIHSAAVQACDAGEAVRRAWPRVFRRGSIDVPQYDRVFLLAIGKASSAMSEAASEKLGKRLTSGIVVTKRGHLTATPPRCIGFEAAHPVPDRTSLQAAAAIHSLLKELTARDLLIVALSGGASALLTAPADGISLKDKQRTTELLLRAGADIRELNAVRKHLSGLKGGRLAALAWPARVVSLILSDVIGDPLDVIGSGPTAPDPTTFADALAILGNYGLTEKVPRAVLQHLRMATLETPKPGDALFEHVSNVIVGSNRLALQAAATEARRHGYRPLILSSRLQGEAREAARFAAAVLREVIESGNPLPAPACLLAGGECTVTVHGNGLGGRAQEFALAAAIDLDGVADVLLLSAGTDGSDGPTDAAGAVVTGETLAQARRRGLDAAAYLHRNDSYRFFDQTRNLVKTGATGTNVMDLCIMLARKS